jgi:hypothetical protein
MRIGGGFLALISHELTRVTIQIYMQDKTQNADIIRRAGLVASGSKVSRSTWSRQSLLGKLYRLEEYEE